MEINNFRGDLSDISAKKEALIWSRSGTPYMTSAFFVADTSVMSPRKLFMFIILKIVFWIKVSKKIVYLILKTEALRVTSKH